MPRPTYIATSTLTNPSTWYSVAGRQLLLSCSLVKVPLVVSLLWVNCLMSLHRAPLGRGGGPEEIRTPDPYIANVVL